MKPVLSPGFWCGLGYLALFYALAAAGTWIVVLALGEGVR